jgi:hypothetical protein
MNRSHRRGFVFALLVVVVQGCGPLTLDTSSQGALDRTARKMRKPMVENESAVFDEALFYLAGTPWLGKQESGAPLGEREIELLAPLDGRTADGIVVEARRRRMLEVRSAVSELESWREKASAARRDLREFRFSEAKVYKRNRDFLDWPVIEFRIDNNTNHMVSMVHFRAVLLRKGDHNPWLVEDFDLVFFDGLAPGEHGRWRIDPKQQEWIALVDPHPDLEFAIEAQRLEAMGGRVLSISDWGVVEARLLEACEQTRNEIRSSESLALDRPPLPSLPPLALEELAKLGEQVEEQGGVGENAPDAAAD